MQNNKIRGIAKCISRKKKKKDAYHYQEFIDRQSRKGRLGGIKSNSSNGGLARSKLFDEKKNQAKELRRLGMKNIEISRQLGITARTLRNWFNLE